MLAFAKNLSRLSESFRFCHIKQITSGFISSGPLGIVDYRMFMSENENSRSAAISFGADIGSLEMIIAVRRASGGIEFVEHPLSCLCGPACIIENLRNRVLPSVGCGSWRLSDTLLKLHGILVEKHREPVCIWTAIEYLLRKFPGDYAYTFNYETCPESRRYPISSPHRDIGDIQKLMSSVSYDMLTDMFPILLVNVKTGTSFYRMDSPTEFVRVGGSSIGVSTIMALGKTLVHESSIAKMIEIGKASGKTSRVDLLVEDIYGGDCSSIGLAGSIIASSLGKASSDSLSGPSDISKSLLDMMCMNTAQLANLHARVHKCKNVLIVGSLADEPLLAECTQRVLHILAGKSDEDFLRAVFIKQSKYLGCLGALLRRESLVQGLGSKVCDVPINTATVQDGVHDETYTKLRISTPPR